VEPPVSQQRFGNSRPRPIDSITDLVAWRRQRERGELAGLSAKRGRKPEPVNPLAKRVAELEREKRRLERKLEQAELLLDIQKKASRLLEIPLRSQDDDGSA